jgi:hypothetical protein
MTITKDIDVLRKEAIEKIAQAEKLEKLEAAFPGIQKRVGRWNKVTYFTKEVNTKVDNFDSRHNCGCCNDSSLEIWPYLQTPDGPVYSDPPCFTVGERDYDSASGDRPYSGWDGQMLSAGIPESVVDRVRAFFSADEEEEESEEENNE